MALETLIADREAMDRPMVFAYADPPYPGKVGYCPERTEVDHPKLIRRLVMDYPDGWALSTSPAALRDVIALVPAWMPVKLCGWFNSSKTTRAQTSWEPLIVAGGRSLHVDAVQDLSDGLIALGRFRAFPGAATGMKPLAFAEWMFRQLGASRHDRLDDLYPGSGAIGLAWTRYVSPSSPRALLASGASPARPRKSLTCG